MLDSDSHKTVPYIGSIRKRIAYVLLLILIPIIVAIVFGGIRFFKVPSSSMEPTLFPSDYIITRKAALYRRGDIVVFRDPDYTNEFLVKRIVGVGGDIIFVLGGAVFLNGSYISEPYRHRPIDYVMESYQVPKGHFFLLGDNANRSIDSHNWGASASHDGEGVKGGPRSISQDLIVGRVRYIYLPGSRRGSLESYPLRGINTD